MCKDFHNLVSMEEYAEAPVVAENCGKQDTIMDLHG